MKLQSYAQLKDLRCSKCKAATPGLDTLPSIRYFDVAAARGLEFAGYTGQRPRVYAFESIADLKLGCDSVEQRPFFEAAYDNLNPKST